MPRIQYESSDSEDDVIIVKGLKNKTKKEQKEEIKEEIKPEIKEIQPEVKEDIKPIKVKKERTQKQIDNTNKMREALKLKREQELIIKEKVRLEHEELKNKIKSKIKKNNVNEKVMKKIKKIVESSSSEEEEQSEDEIIVKKKMPANPKSHPEIKQQVQQVRPQAQQQVPPKTIIRFF